MSNKPSRRNSADIETLLHEAAKRKMTTQERREQEISFVMSTLGRRNTLTREQVAAHVNAAHGDPT